MRVLLSTRGKIGAASNRTRRIETRPKPAAFKKEFEKEALNPGEKRFLTID